MSNTKDKYFEMMGFIISFHRLCMVRSIITTNDPSLPLNR
jgi:hypothetical protein